MNKYTNTAAAGFVAIMAAFPAAADGHRDHDFQIPGSYFPRDFRAAAKEPLSVPIYCSDDFDWRVDPPQPNATLISRLDTNGFNGGEPGEIAFLLMEPSDREAYLGTLTNPRAISGYQGLAAKYDGMDTPEEKHAFTLDTFSKYHRWTIEKYDQISGECDRRGLGLD